MRPTEEARVRATSEPPNPAGGAPANASAFSVLSLATRVLFLLAVVLFLAKLGSQLSHPLFQSDECFHAYVSRSIAEHGTLPRILPEFYSGFYYYYPPLFHLLGALAVKWGGTTALNYVNLALVALLLGLVYAGARAMIGRGSERWAVLLCLASSTLALYTVRLYVEMLIAVITLAALLLLLRLRKHQRLPAAIGLGAIVGLALVCKQSAVILPVGLLVLAAAYGVRGERRLAGGLLVSVTVALAVASPFFIRNAVLFGSPLYPLFGPDVDGALDRMRQYGLPAGAFYARTIAEVGILLLVVFLAAVYVHLRQRRWNLTTGLLVFCLALPAAAPLLPIHDPRHVIPLIPAMIFLATAVLFDLLRRSRWALLAVEGVLIVASLATIVGMPNLRRALDEPPELMEAFQAIAAHVPEDETVLSLWTYDTFYYSGRAATWPIAWGQAVHPVKLLAEQEPDRFVTEMEQYRVRYLLVPQRAIGAAASYPPSLMNCVRVLIEQEKLDVLWRSNALVVVGIGR